MNKRILLSVLALWTLFSCGEKEGPKLNFILSVDPAEAAGVNYVYFQVASQETGGKYLDTNKDGVADVFGYPSNCTSGGTLVKACGYSPTETNYELSGVPLDFNYIVYVFFKDAAGDVVYDGASSEFLNSEAQAVSPINITMNPI